MTRIKYRIDGDRTVVADHAVAEVDGHLNFYLWDDTAPSECGREVLTVATGQWTHLEVIGHVDVTDEERAEATS